MKRCRLFLFVTTLCLSLVQLTLAQTSGETASALPRLVRFGGTVRDLNGSPLTGVAGITFALYSEPTGGAPLWLETQNVTADSNGHYTALLGSTKSEGLPTELFNSEQARWVGVQVQGQAEQPRVLLVSAPYALKAGDAETIGGLPPSAFVLAAPQASGPSAASDAAAIAAGRRDVSPATTSDVTTTGGTANYLPFFTGASTILDSVVYQTGTGSTTRIGINTSAPATTLDVKGSGTFRGALSLPAAGAATATAGVNSEPLNLTASVFNSGTSKAVSHTFQLKAEPVGNDTAAASGALSLLYGSGTSAPAETGLQIASNGQITFAAGQTFPGAGSGTVTSVGSGAGLTGGPITGSGSLSIATGGVSNAMLANPSLTVTAGGGMTGGGSVSLGGGTTLGLKTCSANQVLEYIGNVWTCTTISGGGTITGVTAGTDLTGGGTSGTVTLNLDTTKVPQLAAANTFNANQTINGNLTATGPVSASSFQTGGYILALGSHGAQNAFFGFAGNTTMTGTGNTASGFMALQSNTSGSYNTASGDLALDANTMGWYNTASGYSALALNSTGTLNTAIGYGTGTTADGSYITGPENTLVGAGAILGTGNLTNATAIGANAEVTESNALVLGQISTPAHPPNTNVGIGTTAPLAALDIAGFQLETFIGNPECGAHPFAGIAFGTAGFQSCGNYSMVGDSVNTYIAAPTGDIYFRTQNNNVSAMTIDQYGDVNITGNLSKGGGSFKIDHPLDPANKYLYHSFVESPDMMNIYNGLIVLDANGEALVALPGWFEALNRDFRYQLTAIGAPGPNLYIAVEVANNQFKIAGGKPGSKVSWQVTGIRHDAYADAHRIPTEVEKPPQEQGHYLHPELFGEGPEQAVGSNGRLSSTQALAAAH